MYWVVAGGVMRPAIPSGGAESARPEGPESASASRRVQVNPNAPS